MKFTISTAVLLLAVVSGSMVASSAGPGKDACVTQLEGWGKMADTTSVVPSFVMGGQLDIDQLVVCDNGVFFFFRAREWGGVNRFCLAYPKPSQEETAKFYGRDATDIQERMQEILTVTAEATRAYEAFKTELRDVLGKQYAEGKIISFEKQRFDARLKLNMGEAIEFSWRRRSASFFALIDVYIAPRSNIPAWVIFLIVYPGPA